MKRCPKCGNTEPSSSKFCTACGAPLDDVRQNPFRQEEDLFKTAPEDRGPQEEFLEKPGRQTPPPQPPRKKKTNPAVIIIPVVLILIIAAVGVVLALKLTQDGKDGKEPPQESGTVETNLPTNNLGDIFESETPAPLTETPAQETPVVETPPAETSQAPESPAESPTESQPSDVWTPVNQTGDTSKTTHTYDGVTIQGDYVFPDSNSRYLSESELTGLTKQELAIARNEIYARRGRKFTTDSLQKYFDSCDWYTGRYSADSFDSQVTLNDYEKKNATLILDYEKKMGYK